MTGLVINVGNVPYAKDALLVLEDFFKWNEVPLVVVEEDLSQNYHGAHPSWLKMFCHEIIKDDFIVCWDLDLLPVCRYDMRSEFLNVRNDTKFHIGIECGLLYGWPMDKYGPKFKYNCGFMGVPQSFAPAFKSIYDTFGNNAQNRDCWEQLYVNDYLVDNNVDVHIIRPEYNCSLNNRREFLPNVRNKHYTYGVMDPNVRAEMIRQHQNDYFSKVADASY